MKALKLFFYFSLVTLFAFTCSKNKTDQPESDFELKFGSECGWCAGQEYLTLSCNSVDYVRNIPCGENKGETKKSRSLTENEWNEILSSFSLDLFFTLEYNDCNVCVDGCDELLKITNAEKQHELRYTPSKEVEGMEELINKLQVLMNEMREL